jgi:hypothetical protein
VPVRWQPMADDALDLDMLAASLAADSSDVRVLLNALAGRLADALGNRLQVERSGGGWRKRRAGDIRQISVVIGDDELTASVQEERLQCSIAHRSGGIRIRSESVDLGQWLRALLGSLEREAAYSQASRQALEAIVIGSRGDA